MSASEPVAVTLGRFVANAAWSDLPAGMIHEAKRALLNFTGCALSAADQPAISTAVRVLQPFSGGDPDLPTGAARVVVMCHDGQRAERLVMHARGSASHPMTDAEIEAKMRGLAIAYGRTQALDRIVADFWHFDDLPNVASVMRLLAASVP